MLLKNIFNIALGPCLFALDQIRIIHVQMSSNKLKKVRNERYKIEIKNCTLTFLNIELMIVYLFFTFPLFNFHQRGEIILQSFLFITFSFIINHLQHKFVCIRFFCIPYKQTHPRKQAYIVHVDVVHVHHLHYLYEISVFLYKIILIKYFINIYIFFISWYIFCTYHCRFEYRPN